MDRVINMTVFRYLEILLPETIDGYIMNDATCSTSILFFQFVIGSTQGKKMIIGGYCGR